MRKKVFQHAGALIIAAIILTFFTMSWAMYNNTAEQLRVSVRNECEYYRYFLDKMGDDSLDKPAGKITASRVTLIDTDGTVLFDSVEDENMMGNHSGRPEVIEAEKTGESNISRYSETLRSKTYYTALRLDNGKIIRVSLTTDSVFGVMLRNIWLVVVLIAAVLVVELLMVSHMTKALVKPINESCSLRLTVTILWLMHSSAVTSNRFCAERLMESTTDWFVTIRPSFIYSVIARYSS